MRMKKIEGGLQGRPWYLTAKFVAPCRQCEEIETRFLIPFGTGSASS
jgi:hypothetical protein